MIFSCKECGLEVESLEKDSNGVIKFPKELTTVKLYSNNQFICVCLLCCESLLNNNIGFISSNKLTPEISLKKRFIHPDKEKL